MSKFILSRRTFFKNAALSAGVIGGLGTLQTGALAQSSKSIRLRVSSDQPTDENSPHYHFFQRFAENLKKSVGDAIILDYFPNGQLGKGTDVIQQVKVGSIDVMISGTAYLASVIPEVGMLDLGYLFSSYDHVKKSLSGEVGDALGKLVYDRTGISVLCWSCHFGARNIYARKTLTSLNDLKGMKIRVLPLPAYIQTIEAIGGTPTPVPLNELYTALQTGVVDGCELDVGMILSMKLYEMAKNNLMTEHIFPPLYAISSKRALSKMTPEQQKAFREAALEAAEYQYVQASKKEQVATDELTKLGVKFSPMSKEDRAFAVKACEEQVWAPFIKKYPLTGDLIAKISKLSA